MSEPVRWSLCIFASYLLGSIPFGLLIGLGKGVDIRQHGSRNIGATNTGRVLGKPWGMFCFALDFLKGVIPVLASGWWMNTLGRTDLPPSTSLLWLAVGVASLLGHVFPIYIGFKGGKGVATGFGVMLATWPSVTLPALTALVVWLVALRIWKMVSVASCLAACALPVSLVALRIAGWPRGEQPPSEAWRAAVPYLVVTTLLAALVVWKHRANLARVRAGTEPKVGQAKA